jgi:hypothetical protein
MEPKIKRLYFAQNSNQTLVLYSGIQIHIKKSYLQPVVILNLYPRIKASLTLFRFEFCMDLNSVCQSTMFVMSTITSKKKERNIVSLTEKGTDKEGKKDDGKKDDRHQERPTIQPTLYAVCTPIYR